MPQIALVGEDLVRAGVPSLARQPLCRVVKKAPKARRKDRAPGVTPDQRTEAGRLSPIFQSGPPESETSLCTQGNDSPGRTRAEPPAGAQRLHSRGVRHLLHEKGERAAMAGRGDVGRSLESGPSRRGHKDCRTTARSRPTLWSVGGVGRCLESGPSRVGAKI